MTHVPGGGTVVITVALTRNATSEIPHVFSTPYMLYALLVSVVPDTISPVVVRLTGVGMESVSA